MADYGSSPAVDSVRQSGEQPRSNVSSSSSSTEEEGGDSPVGSPPMISDCSDIYDLVLQCRTEPLGKDNVGNVDVEEEDLLLMLEDESPPLPLPTNPPPTSVVTQNEGRRSRSTSPSWSRSAGSRSRSVSPSPERNHQDDSGIVQVSASASTDLDSLETTSICTSVTTTITTTRIVVYEEGEGPDEDRLVVVSTDKDEANLEEAEGIAVVDDEPLVDFGDVEDGLVVGEVAVVVGRDRRGSSDDSGTGVEVDVSSTPSPLPPSGVDGPGQQLEDASGSSDDEVVVEDAEEGLAVDEGWCGEDREGSHKPLLLDACEKVPVISDDGPVEHSHDAHDGSSSSGDEECRGADDVGGKTGKKKKMKVSSEPEPQPLVIADEQENVDPKQLERKRSSSSVSEGMENGSHEVDAEVIPTGISIKELKSVYVKPQIADDSYPHVSKEVIETGISLVNLRASYCNHAKDEDESKLRREVIETGVSIKALKSSFNSSDGGDSVISESEGVKIDRAKVTRQFSQESCPLYALLEATETSGKEEKSSNCRICGKQVFHMEKVKAERGVFHKTCFRCRECGKQLTVDNYSSHEGVIYCKPHFKTLFQPKAKFDEEPRAPRRKHEMIIKENTPAELPPDVARSADKPDHGLNELPSLRSIKSRFEGSDSDLDASRTSSSVPVKRSESILNRISKFQELADENGHHEHTDSSSEEEDEDEEDGRDPRVLREKRTKEKPIDARDAVNDEGKGSLKLRYESAVEESHRSTTSTGVLPADVNIELTKAKNMKDKFEKGDLSNETEQEKAERVRAAEREEDLSVFKEQGTAVDARNLFKHMEANTKSATTPSPTAPLPAQSVKRSPSLRARELLCSPDEVVKSGSTVEEDPTASIETPALSARFKFFENFEDEIQRRQPERRAFRMTPPREAAKEESPEPLARRDPNVVRACDAYEDDTAVVADTARKMRDKFRELESQAEREPSPGAPKPLKRITPPREFTKDGSGSDSEPDTRRDPNVVRACDKVEDDFLAEAQKAAHKAKNLTARFEHWDRNGNGKAGSDDEEDGDRDRRNGEQEQKPEPDTTKNLKAKFEALKDESAKVPHKAKANVKRFIDHAGSEECDLCGKRVYPVERLDVSGHKIHKTCFRCSHCGNVLRMDNYTSSEGVLYCTPHFKQLFIARGNYDEGFGREQHKDRWNRSRSSTPTPKELNGQGTEQFVFGD